MADASSTGPFGEADFAVGSVLELRTTQGEAILESQVLAYDAEMGCLLLKEAGAHNGVNTIRIVQVRSTSGNDRTRKYLCH